MNDFTKTELQNIYLMACYYASNPINQNESQILLMNKIQSLIEDYCENKCSKIRDINCIKPCPECGYHHE